MQSGNALFSLIGLIFLLPWSVATAQVDATKQAPDSTRLTTAQRREVNRMLNEFRKTDDSKERAKIVDDILTIGPEAVNQLGKTIQREMNPRWVAYRGRFEQQTAKVAQQRLKLANLDEIGRLRQTVLGLRTSGNFTKTEIIAKGDPAMTRLREILVINRLDVLTESDELESLRAKLETDGLLWERCAVFTYEQRQKNIPKAETAKSKSTPPSFQTYLIGEEELIVSLAVPMNPTMRAVVAANARLATEIGPEEYRAIESLNTMRILLGMNPLAIDVKLCAACRDHSQDMEKLKFFSHTSPVDGKKSPWDRAKRFGTSASGENIFSGIRDGKSVTKGWFHSPGHHSNMLGNHNRVGVGRSGAYFTEMLGK